MKSKRSRTYLVSGLTLALIFVAIILVFRDVLPDICLLYTSDAADEL